MGARRRISFESSEPEYIALFSRLAHRAENRKCLPSGRKRSDRCEFSPSDSFSVVNRVEAEAIALGLDIRGTQPSPGNMRGGLTTIEEKSLGATHKAGERTRLEDVVGYSAPITSKGLTVMDTPGLDVESVTGMVGGGAQVVVFTTGLGTPTGNPIAPVIKITGNARTAAAMADNIDLDVSGVLDDRETLEAAAGRLFDEVLAVCSGRDAAAERLGHREFAIHRRNPTI